MANNPTMTNESWPTSGSNITARRWNSLSEDEQAKLKSYLRHRNIIKGNMSPRAATEKVREQVQQATKNAPQRHDIPKNQLIWTYRADTLLDSLLPQRKKIWISRPRRKIKKDITLEGFSFIDHPEQTFSTLKEILTGEATYLPSQFHFDDTNIQDISAYIVLAVMYNRMNKYGAGGRMALSIQKVLKSVGLGSTMKIGLPGGSDFADVYPFPIRSLAAGSQTSTTIETESSKKDKIASELHRCIENWLLEMPESITINDSALQKIGDFVGEVLDNAERHSEGKGSEKGGWWIAGFMARRTTEGTPDRYVCHLGVLSLGDSISDSLLNSPRIPESSFFNLFNQYKLKGGKSLSDEIAATVLSVQDSVSRKPIYDTSSPGGIGMQDLITNVSELGSGTGSRKFAVSIISGRACLHVRSHHISSSDHSKGELRTTWFNETNDYNLPPSKEAVSDIGFKFPGTIIGIRFELDSMHLQNKFGKIVNSGEELLFKVER